MRAQRILEDRYSYISLIPARFFDIKITAPGINPESARYEVTGDLKDMPNDYYLPGSVEIIGTKWRVVITEKELVELENWGSGFVDWDAIACKAGYQARRGA